MFDWILYGQCLIAIWIVILSYLYAKIVYDFYQDLNALAHTNNDFADFWNKKSIVGKILYAHFWLHFYSTMIGVSVLFGTKEE